MRPELSQARAENRRVRSEQRAAEAASALAQLERAARVRLMLRDTHSRHRVFVADVPLHNGAGAQADLHLELVNPDCLWQLMGTERRPAGAPQVGQAARVSVES